MSSHVRCLLKRLGSLERWTGVRDFVSVVARNRSLRSPSWRSGTSSAWVHPSYRQDAPGLCTFSGAEARRRSRRITIRDIQSMRDEQVPICMVTAYSYPQALHAELAEMDIVLVGDSLAMVELGHDTTQYVTLEEMLHHCRAVARGCRRGLVVGDMPFGSCETGISEAVRNVARMIREGAVQAVKIEGGKRLSPVLDACVHSLGVAVMGHIGLRPQSFSARGGFRPFGTNATEAAQLLEDALALQEAGAFALVLECVPERLATAVTSALRIPTIGIGAGAGTSGQVLVYHDLCGMMTHPHHAKVTPKFCRRFAEAGAEIHRGLVDYRTAVKQRRFPSAAYAPYQLDDGEWERFGAVYEQLTGQDLTKVTGSTLKQQQQKCVTKKTGSTASDTVDDIACLYRGESS